MDASWNVCPICGVTKNQAILQEMPTNVAPQVQKVVMMQQAPKSMGVAMLLNFIWPGVGHMYFGAFWRGIVFAMVTLCLIPITLIGGELFPLFLCWLLVLLSTPNHMKRKKYLDENPQKKKWYDYL